MKKDVIVCIGTVGRPTFKKCYEHVVELKKRDPRVKKIVVIENQPSQAAWLNKMREACVGYTWCLQVDEDMYVNSDCVDKLLRLARDKESCGSNILNASGMLYDIFLNQNVGSLKLWRSSALKMFEFRDVLGSDRDIAKRAGEVGLKNVSIVEVLGSHDSAPDVSIARDKYYTYAKKLYTFYGEKRALDLIKNLEKNSLKSPVHKSAFEGAVQLSKECGFFEKNIALEGEKEKVFQKISSEVFWKKNLVSIVVTNFNKSEKSILRALRSAVSQTYKNIEIYYVDDASTVTYSESFWGELYGLLSEDMVFVSDTNLGTYCCRNFILKNCNGEFFTNLDSDDEILPDHIEKIIALMNKDGFNLGQSKMKRLSSDGTLLEEKTCEASFTVRRSKVIPKIGYYNPVMVGGDTEFKQRAIIAFENKISTSNSKSYIAYYNEKESNLTKSFPRKDRLKYKHCFMDYLSLNGYYYCGYNSSPPFFVPEENISSRKKVSFSHKRNLVISGIASIPERKESLKNTVVSLITQVDFLYVYLNGYGHIPSFLKHDKVKVFQSEDFGDIGDAGKFFKVGQASYLYLSCDDDIVYPKDYVSEIKKRLLRYNDSVVVSFHGSIFKHPYMSYYESRKSFNYNLETEKDVEVDILGTGVMAMYPKKIGIDISNIKFPNMADVWVARFCSENKINMVCLKKKEGWLVTDTSVQAQSICETLKKSDKKSVLYNEIEYQVSKYILKKKRGCR